MKLFEKINAKEINPELPGWYNTDKGWLFWYMSETCWSCRDDKLSEEYPTVWYKPYSAQTT